MRRRTRAGRRTLRRLDVLLVAVAVLAVGGAGVAIARTPGSAGSSSTRSASPGAPASLGVATPVHWPAAVFLGDSWTAGNDMGGRGAANWSAVLSAALRWYPTNLAYGGTSYDLGAPTLQFGSPNHLRSVATAAPDVVIVANGVNDINRIGLDQWQTDTAATFAALRAEVPTARLVVIGIIAPGPASAFPFFSRWNDVLAATARDHDAVFLDAYGEDWFGGAAASSIGSDRYHPTDAGNVYLAGRVRADLERDGVVGELEKVRT